MPSCPKDQLIHIATQPPLPHFILNRSQAVLSFLWDEAQPNPFQFSPAAQILKGQPLQHTSGISQEEDRFSPGWLTRQKGRVLSPPPQESNNRQDGRARGQRSVCSSLNPASHVDSSSSPPTDVLADVLGRMFLEQLFLFCLNYQGKEVLGS